MKFSENWLRSFCSTKHSTDELLNILTMAGLEVESVEPLSQGLTGVVVGRIETTKPHPNADKLKLCSVDVGDEEPLQIVCGAPNAKEGMLVPTALVGAALPGGLSIKKTKLRGELSLGMLCSAKELALSEDHSGLMNLDGDCQIGADVKDVLGLNDNVFTLKLTANRGDCLSIKGIARELQAITGVSMHTPDEYEALNEDPGNETHVVIEAEEACPIYLGLEISGINAKAKTPQYIVDRLERSGIRAISAVVDLTNYVMLELGQPMHSFDKDKLHGKVSVRFGRAGEAIELLNGTNLEVTSEHLVIADEDGPIALAGIMGGELSSVTDVTQNIFLEAAVFSQESVAGKWRSLGFSTDALHRFERGVDPSGSKAALARLAKLIVDVCGGKIGALTSAGSDKVERKPILFRCDRVKRLIGIDVTQDRILEIFSGLELAVSSSGDDLIVTPPSYRFDLVLEADLIEEIARIEGFDKLPATLPRATSSMLRIADKMGWPECAQRHFVDRSYHEVITYSFISEDLEKAFGSGRDPVRLANPIAEQYSVMRSSLLGSLILTLQKNLSHLPDRVRILETSLCFEENNGVIDQKIVIAGLCYGRRLPEQWSVDDKSVDFFDIKGDVEEFLSGEDISFHRLEDSRLHPGKSASIVISGVRVGIVGEIHPQLASSFDIGDGVFVFELQVDKLPRSSPQRFMPYSKYQRVRRDISIEVNSDIEVSDIVEAIESESIPFLQKVGIFDVYEKAESTDSTKSLAFSISFQDTKKTLTDEEVEKSILQIRSLLGDRFGARLRGN